MPTNPAPQHARLEGSLQPSAYTLHMERGLVVQLGWLEDLVKKGLEVLFKTSRLQTFRQCPITAPNAPGPGPASGFTSAFWRASCVARGMEDLPQQGEWSFRPWHRTSPACLLSWLPPSSKDPGRLGDVEYWGASSKTPVPHKSGGRKHVDGGSRNDKTEHDVTSSYKLEDIEPQPKTERPRTRSPQTMNLSVPPHPPHLEDPGPKH